jgi:hypothetical protein
VVVRWLPRPELAETNYVANRLRIERWMLGPPASNVIVGTSIGGRLLPAYFDGTRLATLANLGLDGANPDTGLNLVLQRSVPPARVFLEVHRLLTPPSNNDRKLLDLVEGPGMAVSRALPWTRADWRPSTVLYGWLKRRQTGSASAPADAGTPSGPGSGVDPGWLDRVRQKIASIEAKGSKVILLRLPVGRENSTLGSPDPLVEAASRLGLPMVDLQARSLRDGVTISYTDGLHLAPSSAEQVSKWLAEESP